MSEQQQTPDAGESEYGPAMAALTEKQRRFVLAALADPKGNASQWAKAAGFSPKGNNHQVAAYRLMHNPKVEAAIFEVARANLNTLGPLLAARGMLKIAADERHPEHGKMLLAVADRVGLHPRTEHKVTVQHLDEREMLKIAAQMAAEWGVDVATLVGGNSLPGPKLIEGEATEVEEAELNDGGGSS